ncbi:MAG TPA: ABC transporter substrate-binding protein [Chloroflexi bacterium]|nr:ABC transporter substrate-binding protein [Chloroflexota bacterium]
MTNSKYESAMSETNLSQFSFPEWEVPPKRVVSLVPSVTESLFELGFGGSLVGITDYCSRPAQGTGNMVRVGGTKRPDLELIQSLSPDLVIANQEETQREQIEELAEKGIKVWLIFPKNVQDSLDLLRQFLALYHSDKDVMKVNSLQVAVDYARMAGESEPATPYFCPIWYDFSDGTDWWMTFNQKTYPHDLLKLFGGINVFAERERMYPIAADIGSAKSEPAAGRDTRYPRVTAAEVIAAQPELILLPSEPYSFAEKDKQVILYTFADTPAVRQGRVFFVEGSYLTWYGVRLAKALQSLPEFFYRH